MITLLFAALTAFAGDVYPVADYGLSVTMADNWRGIRFSDDDFQAETADQSIKFMITGVKTQDVPRPDDKNWADGLKKNLEANGGTEISEGTLTADDLGDLPRLRAHYDFTLPNGKTKAAAEYVVYPVEGATAIQLAFGVDPVKVKAAMALWEKQIVVQKPPKKLEDGPVVTMEGASTDLPAGWHIAGKQERNAASYRTDVMGVRDLAPCWIAVSPRGMNDPALLIGCPIYMRIGILDEYNFAYKEADLRKQLFGDAPIATGTEVKLADRTGVRYHVPIQDKGMDLVVVPDSTGLARFWALGKEAEMPSLAAALTEAVNATTFEGPHPVSADDMLTYYPIYRPTHPYSLGAFGGCLCSVLGVFGLLFLGARLQAARRAQDVY